MSKVKNENYITIQGWMINELNLKGNELLVYATIYGFSQTENQLFTGSLQYLADWTNSSKQGIQKNLKSLIDKGYIVKNDKYINGVKFCEYYATKFNEVCNSVVQGMQQNSTPTIQQSCNNNIDFNNKDNTINNNKESKKVSNNSNYDDIINELVKDDDIKEGIYEFIKMRKLIKKPLTDRALKQLINKLFTLSTNKEELVQIIDNSIINNWASVFPLKKENNKQGYKRKEIIPDWLEKENNGEPIEKKQATPEEELEMLIELNEGINNPNFERRIAALKKQIAEKNNLSERVAALKEKLQN